MQKIEPASLMTNNKLAELTIDNLNKPSSANLQAQTVAAVVIALGSNHQAEQHLACVHKSLRNLGSIKLSTAFDNPDFTATLDQLKPDYTNQCAYLSLNSAMTLQQLQILFQQLESDCNRQRQTEQNAIEPVTMDIDILLVKLENNSGWIVMTERYPFKDHEKVGLMELNF